MSDMVTHTIETLRELKLPVVVILNGQSKSTPPDGEYVEAEIWRQEGFLSITLRHYKGEEREVLFSSYERWAKEVEEIVKDSSLFKLYEKLIGGEL